MTDTYCSNAMFGYWFHLWTTMEHEITKHKVCVWRTRTISYYIFIGGKLCSFECHIDFHPNTFILQRVFIQIQKKYLHNFCKICTKGYVWMFGLVWFVAQQWCVILLIVNYWYCILTYHHAVQKCFSNIFIKL